jgi:putative SOS response-associated peptidase YedK
MCGRYVSPDEAAMERYWHIGARNSGRWIQQIYNVAPTMTVPIVLNSDDGSPEVLPARWGLIPGWWKKPSPPTLTFNARSEEAAEKPMWRQSYRSRRCLMPAQGWYEWNAHEPALSRSGRKVKQPYYIHAPDDTMLSFAALWSCWQGPDDQKVLSCALLTTEAAPAIHAIHNRMPVVLAPEHFDLWLSASLSTAQIDEAVALARHDLMAHSVSTEVNNTRNDYPELVQRLSAGTAY